MKKNSTWNDDSRSASQEFLTLYGTRRSNTSPLDPNLSKMSLVHILTPYLC
jgi:hypothetical protein